jgi:hypothetical protein
MKTDRNLYKLSSVDQTLLKEVHMADTTPDYQKLFKSDSFHTVDPARSVLSPAAYFVDLMRLCENNIMVGEKDSTLQSRRPDLWNITLDKINTDTPVSKLEIVNTVLKKALGSDSKGLELKEYPFNLPHNQSLAEIRRYLSQNKTGLPEMWRDLIPSAALTSPVIKAINLETLGLSPEQWKQYSKPDTGKASLQTFYGLPPDKDPVTTLKSVEAFLEQTGLDRNQLSELLYEDLSETEIEKTLNAEFFINVETTAPLDVKDQQLVNLSNDRLDHIHRFVRLAQALKWPFTDLDWALRTIGNIINNGTPVINDDALPYLARIQTQKKDNGLSINQCCAMIGTLKDVGKKNGPAFFSRVFEAPGNPKLPDGSPSWTVPEPGAASGEARDKQIQNALAAALKVSQDDLLTIAHLALKSLNNGKNPLTLNRENLAILYRLSLLPKLTGLSIKESLLAACLSDVNTSDLAGSPGADVITAFNQLADFAEWLKSSPFSVYQLQFILKGTSDDLSIQNKILGTETITNFLQSLHSSVEKTLLTETSFFQALKTKLQQEFSTLLNSIGENSGKSDPKNEKIKEALSHSFTYTREISNTIYTELKYIASTGIVRNTDLDEKKLQTLVSNAVMKVVNTITVTGSDDSKEDAKGLTGEIVSILKQSYHLQQETFIKHLAALYHVSAETGSVLKDWADLNIDMLIKQELKLPGGTKQDREAAIPILQKLQQAAQLITTLSLSPVEARYFKAKYNANATAKDPITLESVKTMVRFKELVKSFQDTQNSLLAILKQNEINDTTGQLVKLSGWDQGQIEFLNKELKVGGKYTVDTLTLMHRYFNRATDLGIDIPTLWQLTQATSASFSDLANGLRGGMQKRYGAQPEVLTGITNSLNEALRDRLVPLTMHKCKLSTPRALYEHFLIDVEVSGAIQTSKIKEAISAVQLYIYRCLNHLEQDVTVNSNLTVLWGWMNSYRVWQANREVFLYPEDYIQPELRKNKTDLFSKVENDLKQADLTNPDSAEGIFKEYMNGFAEIGNLKIVGSAARDMKIAGGDGDELTKELCMVGKQEPQHYYYRVATFIYSKDTNQYEPVDWGQWQKINIQIQPVKFSIEKDKPEKTGAVIPVCAFGKWYVFWVEQKKAGGTTDKEGTHTPQYTATIHYSYLDFSKLWTAAQTLVSIDLKSSQISLQEDSTVYPVYFYSVQTLYVPYKDILYQLTESPLSQSVTGAFRFKSAKGGPPQNASLDKRYSDSQLQFQYYSTLKETMDNNSASLSTWFKVGRSDQPLPLWGNVIKVQAGKSILVKNNESPKSPNIAEDTWYHLAISTGTIYLDGKPAAVAPISSLYAGTDKGLFSSPDGKTWTSVTEGLLTPSTLKVWSLYSYHNTLYAGTGMGLFSSPDGKTWTSVTEGLHTPYTPVVLSLYSYHNTLYAETSLGPYSSPDGKTWTPVEGLFDTWSVVSLYSYHNTLYAGKISKGLYSSPDGKTWTPVGGLLSSLTVLSLYSYHNTLYAGTDKGLYSSPDGKTWTSVTEGLLTPSTLEVRSLYSYHNTLYAGTDKGLYSSPDGKTWTSVTEGLPTPSTLKVMSLYNYHNTLYAGTKKGLYSSPDGKTWTPVTGEPSPVSTNSLYLFFLSLSPDFTGSTQETLYFKDPLSEQQIKALYEHSKDYVTTDFENFIPTGTAFGEQNLPVNLNPVLSQPNWNIIDCFKAQYLNIPYLEAPSSPLLNCYRLNSTAIHHLGSLLHQPAGIDALLTVPAQRSPEFPFENLKPDSKFLPVKNNPSDQLDFTLKSAMSPYYWELFFHLPFLIANQLRTHQHFEQTRAWLEYIFNPGVHEENWDLEPNEAPNDKFWRFLGLRSADNPIFKNELSSSPVCLLNKELKDGAEEYEYETDPFDPHEIASLRPIAYQKTIVIHYIGNLLDWGDMLFRQNSRESIVEAEMFYVAAYDLLGEQPKNLGPDPSLGAPTCYAKIKAGTGWVLDPWFGIPRNTQFLSLWDTVKQRLYNIRHSLTIDGKTDILPLFQPPIDPMQIVAAAASGEGLDQGSGSHNSVIPYYRFSVMIEKAKEVTQTVIQLGQSLLSALEKKDAEQLAMLYNTQQQHMSELTRASKEDQLNAAEQNLLALQSSLINAQTRQQHYAGLIAAGLSSAEQKQLSMAGDAISVQSTAEAIKTAAIAGYSAPVIFGFSDGGMKIGDAVNQGASIVEGLGNLSNLGSNLAGINAGYLRRAEDWQLQETLAGDDIDRIQYNIVAAQYQQHLASQEIALLEESINQEKKIAEFYQGKFTNNQLYLWYIGQVSAIYFQAYQLAHEIAVQAENAWAFEHMGRKDDSTRFIKPGYWNSLHQGLLSGEALLLDLQRMEKTFTDQNERRLEIVKTIALSKLCAQALKDLKEKGHCVFDIMEKDFDCDFPGHYCRKIKSLSISLPMVIGPYQNIHATLTQLTNKIVTMDNDEGQTAVKYLLGQGKLGTSHALKVDIMPNQQVALSQGVNDSGLFQLNFNDARYLPFEGTGAVSIWMLELPKENNGIDFKSITDVIIQLNYTALAGSVEFKKCVQDARECKKKTK